MKPLFNFLILFFGLYCSSVLQAHQSSHSQIVLHKQGSTLTGGWHIALDDLERSQGLDLNGDGQLHWGELLENESLIGSLAKSQLGFIQSMKPCDVSTKDIMLDKLSTGLYVYLPITVLCADKIEILKINYNFLFAFDAQHKAIMNLSSNDSDQSFVFSSGQREMRVDFNPGSRLQNLLEFTWQGVWHIWIGLDHILFLLCLFLPVALSRVQGRWQPDISFKQTILNTLKIVSAFTLAHSITLSFSMLGYISLSSQLVESVIAASVIVAALNNIKPVFYQRLWLLTFVFGLVHGMGFASVLSDLGLAKGEEVLSLIGFNIGIELGQLFIAMLVLPVIYYLSRRFYYRRGLMQSASLVISLLAVVWLIERAAQIELVRWI